MNIRSKKGLIVRSVSGKTGTTRTGQGLVNGKVIVYLEDNGKPVLDENGKQKALLCSVSDLEIIGFVD